MFRINKLQIIGALVKHALVNSEGQREHRGFSHMQRVMPYYKGFLIHCGLTRQQARRYGDVAISYIIQLELWDFPIIH